MRHAPWWAVVFLDFALAQINQVEMFPTPQYGDTVVEGFAWPTSVTIFVYNGLGTLVGASQVDQTGRWSINVPPLQGQTTLQATYLFDGTPISSAIVEIIGPTLNPLATTPALDFTPVNQSDRITQPPEVTVVVLGREEAEESDTLKLVGISIWLWVLGFGLVFVGVSMFVCFRIIPNQRRSYPCMWLYKRCCGPAPPPKFIYKTTFDKDGQIRILQEEVGGKHRELVMEEAPPEPVIESDLVVAKPAVQDKGLRLEAYEFPVLVGIPWNLYSGDGGDFGATDLQIGVTVKRRRDGNVTVTENWVPSQMGNLKFLQPGDVITAIDDWRVESKSAGELDNLLSGPPGSHVRIAIIRDGRPWVLRHLFTGEEPATWPLPVEDLPPIAVRTTYRPNGSISVVDNYGVARTHDPTVLQSGDVITALDGWGVRGNTGAQLCQMLRGPPGTPIHVSVLREGRPTVIIVNRPGEAAVVGTHGPRQEPFLDTRTNYHGHANPRWQRFMSCMLTHTVYGYAPDITCTTCRRKMHARDMAVRGGGRLGMVCTDCSVYRTIPARASAGLEATAQQTATASLEPTPPPQPPVPLDRPKASMTILHQPRFSRRPQLHEETFFLGGTFGWGQGPPSTETESSVLTMTETSDVSDTEGHDDMDKEDKEDKDNGSETHRSHDSDTELPRPTPRQARVQEVDCHECQARDNHWHPRNRHTQRLPLQPLRVPRHWHTCQASSHSTSVSASVSDARFYRGPSGRSVEDIAEWMCDMQQTLDGVTQWAEPPALMQELSPAFSQELSKTRWQHVAVDDGVATWEDVVSHN